MSTASSSLGKWGSGPGDGGGLRGITGEKGGSGRWGFLQELQYQRHLRAERRAPSHGTEKLLSKGERGGSGSLGCALCLPSSLLYPTEGSQMNSHEY